MPATQPQPLRDTVTPQQKKKKKEKKKASLSRLCLYNVVNIRLLKTMSDDLLRQNNLDVPARVSTSQTNQLHF
jgi:hypothetical protein